MIFAIIYLLCVLVFCFGLFAVQTAQFQSEQLEKIWPLFIGYTIFALCLGSSFLLGTLALVADLKGSRPI